MSNLVARKRDRVLNLVSKTFGPRVAWTSIAGGQCIQVCEAQIIVCDDGLVVIQSPVNDGEHIALIHENYELNKIKEIVDREFAKSDEYAEMRTDLMKIRAELAEMRAL